MRTEQEILSLILNVAKENDAIRCVVMNGSRVNPNAKKDIWQDFDVVYYVQDINTFPKNPKWLDAFGERLIMQTLDDMIFDPCEPTKDHVYLMQFIDGNRIDLTIREIKAIHEDLKNDSLSEILLDKDKITTNKITPNEASYYVKKPSEALFASCINELQWVSLYVLKGVKRGEFTYAFDHLNIIRNCLIGLLDWKIAYPYDYQISRGKHGKYYKDLLPKSYYDKFMSTYEISDIESLIKDTLKILELSNELALDIAKHHDFKYDENTYQNVINYIYKKLED